MTRLRQVTLAKPSDDIPKGKLNKSINKTGNQPPVSKTNIPPSQSNIPPEQVGPTLARTNNTAGDFLAGLDKLVEELSKLGGKYNEDTLKKLKAICLRSDFNFKMDFKGCRIKNYPNLKEHIEQESLKRFSTPISLIVETLSNLQGSATKASIELLSLIPNLQETLGAPIYRNFSDSPAAYMTNNSVVVDWLLERGAARELNDKGRLLFESGINIAKLDRKLHLLTLAEENEVEELKVEIKDLFKQSIINNEKRMMKATGNTLELVDETQDAVTVLLNTDRINDLPTDFILDLLQIAVDESFDFKAFGRDYGVQNLLYKVCRSHCNPPDIEIIKFLLKQGLDPNTEITRLDPHDGLLIDSNEEGKIEDFSHTGKIVLSTKNLVQDNLVTMRKLQSSGKFDDYSNDLEKFQNIADLFKK